MRKGAPAQGIRDTFAAGNDAEMSSESPSAKDEDLVAEIAAGRSEALDALYSRYAPLVFGIARRSLDAGAAEEMVQDVFVALWRKAGSYDPARGPVRPWLLQIAHFRVANELRRMRRRPRPTGDGEDALSRISDPGLDASERLALETRHLRLKTALAGIPDRERRAIGMSYFQDLSHAQVADALGVPLGTAKSRIRLGIARLRSRLVAASLAILVAAAGALYVSRARRDRTLFDRDERALSMLTSSDSETIRLGGAPGSPAGTHATYRFRHGSPIAVVTLSNFPPAPAGRLYRVWIDSAGRWTSVASGMPGPDGRARLIAEGPLLEARPDRIEVRLESAVEGTPRGGSLVAGGPGRD